MTEQEIRNHVEQRVMVCFTEEGFYPIDALTDVPIEKQAQDTGEINGHLIRIETPFGRILWERHSILDDEIIL